MLEFGWDLQNLLDCDFFPAVLGRIDRPCKTSGLCLFVRKRPSLPTTPAVEKTWKGEGGRHGGVLPKEPLAISLEAVMCSGRMN